MSTLTEKDIPSVLADNQLLPDELLNIHKEINRFFIMDDLNIIDRAQAASQFAAFVRTGYYAKKRKKTQLERRHKQLCDELMLAFGLSQAIKYKFDQQIAGCVAAINEGRTLTIETSRLLTDPIKEKILEYYDLGFKIEDTQLAIDYLGDMFEVSKNYSYNIGTAAKLITSER